MKKILCLFGALSLLLSSCSSQDSPSSDSAESSVLLKKVILTSQDGQSKVNVDYKYDGNKIVSITDDSGEVGMYYTYTGDLITKIEFKLPDGTIEQTNTFKYNSEGKLSEFLRVESDNGELRGHKEVFTHNADGTISVKLYSGDADVQDYLSGTSTIKFVDGEVTDIINSESANRKYTYDIKNNPAKHILGFEKIAFVDGEATGIAHNEIKETSDGAVVATYSYTYNSDGYPVKSVDYIDGSNYSTEYFY